MMVEYEIQRLFARIRSKGIVPSQNMSTRISEITYSFHKCLPFSNIYDISFNEVGIEGLNACQENITGVT